MNSVGVRPPSIPNFACTPRSLIFPPLLPRVVASIQQRPSSPACSKVSAWEVFGKEVSGEWDGFGAEFGNDGKPWELPAAVVPDAFREWEVQLYDWQTQCPTIANKNFCYKLIRLLPTVGCEADAATQYSIDERWVDDSSSGGKYFAFHVSGSYVAVWPGKKVLRENLEVRNGLKNYVWEDAKQASFEIEHCFVQDGQPKSRVRILHQIVLETSKDRHTNSISILKSVTVQRENWESEFRNGEVLGGCSSSGSAFATTQTLRSSDLLGVWHSEIFSTKLEPLHAGVQELVQTDSVTEIRKPLQNSLLLPKGLWSELIELEGGNFLSIAGWLVKADAAITSDLEFVSTGEVKRAWLKLERREQR